MYKFFLKRFFDIALSLFAIPFVIVLIVIFGPIIYFTDRGPIFYCGERIGKKGKIFKMVKFRSMYVNSPDIRLADGSTYNGEDDKRVTKIGKFLRKTSIDEMPQFFNVLIGQMSIIGPRPDTPKGLHRYPEEEKYYLSVKPGITGYSQAYFRNSVDGKTKAINDMYYAKRISFIFDVTIMLKTITTVLFHKGTYKGSDETQMIGSAKEIGSNFEAVNYDTNKKNVFWKKNKKTIWLRSARECLFLAGKNHIKNNNAKIVLIPSLCCKSMVQPFAQLGYKVEFYNINESFCVDENDLVAKIGESYLILFMNYFGKKSFKESFVRYLIKTFKASAILDCTHIIDSFWNDDGLFDYKVVSLRKWVPIPDGGLIKFSSKNVECSEIVCDDFYSKLFYSAMEAKARYLINPNDSLKQEYLNTFNLCREILNKEVSPVLMSDKSLEILKRLDWKKIRKRRRQNYNYLAEKLSSLSEKLSVVYNFQKCPFSLPILIDDRDSLQKYLASEGIYCQVLWPLPHGSVSPHSFDETFSKRMLSIPCDQRYDTDDMERIYNAIARYYYKTNV